MPTAFTVPTPHPAPQAFPAFHSRSPAHTTATLKQTAEKASAHRLAPGVALAEMSPCDHLSLEWPVALPLSQGLLFKLPGKAPPRLQAWCLLLSAALQLLLQLSSFPGLPTHTSLPHPCPLAFSDCGCISGKRSSLRITHNSGLVRRVRAAPVTPQWVLLAGTQGRITLALQAWPALDGSGILILTGLFLPHKPL